MDLKKIEALMKMMRKYDINQVALSDKEDGQTLRITVHPSGGTNAVAYLPQRSSEAVPGSSGPRLTPEVTTSNSTETASGRTMIRSPFVGTFYAAPGTDAKPFVKIGQRIEVGDVLCIVEAMKLMNEIEADTAGTVVEILVKNETAVEYDQPLFIVE